MRREITSPEKAEQYRDYDVIPVKAKPVLQLGSVWKEVWKEVWREVSQLSEAPSEGGAGAGSIHFHLVHF